MPKLQIKATELVDPDVNVVAMVKRGANRLPFRITKEDTTDMIDLAKIGLSLFQKKEVAPAIVGVVIAKGADVDGITAALVASGVPADKFVKAEAETSVTLTKADADKVEAGETAVVKLSDEVAVVVQGNAELMKSLCAYDWESTSFAEVMSKGAFTPSVCMAQEMLQRTFFNIMEKADDTSELSKLMKSAIDEFGAYVTQLAKGLPKSVFKADIALKKADAEKKAKAKPADEAKKEPEKKVVKDGEALPEGSTVLKGDVVTLKSGGRFADGEVEVALKEDIADNPAHGNATPKVTGTKVNMTTGDQNIDENPAHGNATPRDPGTKPDIGLKAPDNNIEGKPAVDVKKNEGDADIGKKGKGQTLPESQSGSGAQQAMDAPSLKKGEGGEDVMAALAALTKALGEGLTGIKTHVDQSVKAVKDDVGKISGRVGQLADQVQKTDEALNGTVLGEAGGDKAGVQKSERSEGTNVYPLLDTAFMKLDDGERKKVA